METFSKAGSWATIIGISLISLSYGAGWVIYSGFYQRFGLKPSEAGLDRNSILISTGVIAAILATLLGVFSAAVLCGVLAARAIPLDGSTRPRRSRRTPLQHALAAAWLVAFIILGELRVRRAPATTSWGVVREHPLEWLLIATSSIPVLGAALLDHPELKRRRGALRRVAWGAPITVTLTVFLAGATIVLVDLFGGMPDSGGHVDIRRVALAVQALGMLLLLALSVTTRQVWRELLPSMQALAPAYALLCLLLTSALLPRTLLQNVVSGALLAALMAAATVGYGRWGSIGDLTPRIDTRLRVLLVPGCSLAVLLAFLWLMLSGYESAQADAEALVHRGAIPTNPLIAGNVVAVSLSTTKDPARICSSRSRFVLLGSDGHVNRVLVLRVGQDGVLGSNDSTPTVLSLPTDAYDVVRGARVPGGCTLVTPT